MTSNYNVCNLCLLKEPKVPKDALNIPGLIRAATNAIALIGATNFELNIRRRDNIKQNWTRTTSKCVPAQYRLLSPCLATILNCPNSLKTSLRQQKLEKVQPRRPPKWTPTNTRGWGISSTPSPKDLDTNTEVKRRTQTSSYTGKNPVPHTTSIIKRGGGKANRSKKTLYRAKWFRMSVSGR